MVKKFSDVMADLGLYEVMLKCLQFADQDEVDDLIFLDCKTGCIGDMEKKDCIDKKILNVMAQDENGEDVFQEAATDDESKTRVLKILRENVKLALGFGIVDNQYDANSVTMSEAEKVKNLWGVSLKKTLKNQKGHEFFFICRTSKQFGELSRTMCINKKIVTEVKGDKGEITLGEAKTEFEERAALVEEVRRLIDIGIETPS